MTYLHFSPTHSALGDKGDKGDKCECRVNHSPLGDKGGWLFTKKMGIVIKEFL